MNRRGAKVILWSFSRGCTTWWSATVRFIDTTVADCDYRFCYDTTSFPTKKEAMDEASAFAKWKGLRIVKWEER